MSTKAGSILFSLFVVVWIAVGALLYNVGGFNTNTELNSTSISIGQRSVTYQVTGSAPSASVTLFNSTGGMVQYSDVSLPYTKTYSDYDYWYASILAQNMGASGSVTVKIIVNGQVVKQSTSSGAYVIATSDYSFY
ncbi:MAG: MmpS family transport accessory protein [Dehalococcoidales bacterium]